MKIPCPSPISQENFAEIWSFVDEKRRTAKKKLVIGKVASGFSNLVFSLLLFVAAQGLIHDHFTGSYCEFLETVPYLLPIWDSFAGLALKPGQSLALQTAITLGVIYVLCFLVFCLLMLLVMAVYHPLKKQQPEADVKECAGQLLVLAKDARLYSKRNNGGSGVVCAVLFSTAVFAVMAMYWVMVQDMEAFTELIMKPVMDRIAPYVSDPGVLMSMRGNLFFPVIMVDFLLLFMAYSALNGVHGLTTRYLHLYRVPYSFVAQVEEYHVFCDEDVAELTPEEVAQRHREQAAEKREKALELERMGAHGKAKELLAEAAHGGDVAAMEHYARHWLIVNSKDPARFWLEKCVASGEASEAAVKMLRRLKWRRTIQVRYLKEDT